MSASLFRRLSAFFESASDQAPKAARFAVLIPGPEMFVNVQLVSRVMIAPIQKRSLFRRAKAAVCAVRGWGGVCTHRSPFETNVAMFVPEVLKSV